MTARTVLSTRANIISMSDSPDTRISPIGRTVAEDIAQRRAEDPEYRRLDDYYRPMMDLATAVILRRGALGMTQEELARRMGTTASSISRVFIPRGATSLPFLSTCGTRSTYPLIASGMSIIAVSICLPGSFLVLVVLLPCRTLLFVHEKIV